MRFLSLSRALRRPGALSARCLACGLVAAAFFAATDAVAAHELGAMQVSATFLHAGRYRVEIKLDEEHLKAAQMGGPVRRTRYGRIAGLGGAAEQRLGRFASAVVDAAGLAFDGRRVVPERLDVVPPEPGTPDVYTGRVVLRMEGPIPRGAHAFVWSNTLPIGRYPLVLENEGEEFASWKWLDSGQPSPPFALAAAVVPPELWRQLRPAAGAGFSGVLPGSPETVLLLIAMVLLSRRGVPLPLQVAVLLAGELAALGLGTVAMARPAGLDGQAALWQPGGRLAGVLLGLSLAAVALANLRAAAPGAGRLLLLLGAGLAHGLTMAGALNELAATSAGTARPLAAAAFSAGLVAAQAVTLAVAMLLFVHDLRDRPWYRSRVVVPCSCLLAALGLIQAAGGLVS